MSDGILTNGILIDGIRFYVIRGRYGGRDWQGSRMRKEQKGSVRRGRCEIR